jgi:hypothetical protein
MRRMWMEKEIKNKGIFAYIPPNRIWICNFVDRSGTHDKFRAYNVFNS